MTALLMSSPPLEAKVKRPQLPTGCPLPAILQWPEHPSGVVLVLHAGRRVASVPSLDDLATELRRAGLATVLVDLAPESRHEPIVPSPAPLLAHRAREVVTWLANQRSIAGLPLGLMGMNGAAAAVLAAAGESSRAEAVVIWGGEPDQAEEALPHVVAPVLLLASGTDLDALRHHQIALLRLGGIKRLVAITRSGRGCTGVGDAAEATRWSAIWFVHHLAMERTWRHARSAGV